MPALSPLVLLLFLLLLQCILPPPSMLAPASASPPRRGALVIHGPYGICVGAGALPLPLLLDRGSIVIPESFPSPHHGLLLLLLLGQPVV
ncbi:hypothetical protein GALMADRAFT_232182 [Galerina marginata CBS 339.88]|uniref:Secreted protein n=1 Tax=Galerina marginata (strain CBS 339.88) TaxID=685588 RepID=A0A067S8E1_GALM3|nr:hypothetical protein GALMADRAFT_232182 [Galerina marginata CBS 339.88]